MASSDQSTSVVDVEVEKVVEEKKMEEGEESGEKISELEKRKSVEERHRVASPQHTQTHAHNTHTVYKEVTEQIEFYFSDENLPTDMHMLEVLAKGKGRVSIKHILSFRRMKRMILKARKKMKNVLIVKNVDIVKAALTRFSTTLCVSDDNQINRKIPFTGVNLLEKSQRTCTVRFPRSAKGVDSVREQFESARGGKVLVVKFEENTNQTKATVEFENEKQMMEACEILNDVENWRFGLRVEPVLDAQKKVLKKKLAKSKKEEMSKKKNDAADEIEKDLGWGSRFKPRKPRRIRQFHKKSKDEKSEKVVKSDDVSSSSQEKKNTTDKDQETLVLCRYAKGPDDTIGFQLLRVSVQEQ